MNCHHAHRILVGFRHRVVGYSRPPLNLVVNPLQKFGERPTACAGKTRGLLHHETVTSPLLPHPGMTGSRFHQLTVSNESVDQRLGGFPDPLRIEISEDFHALGDRPFARQRQIVKIIEGSALLPVQRQVDIAARERLRPQCGHRGNLVRRIVDGFQAVQQIANFLGLKTPARRFPAGRECRAPPIRAPGRVVRCGLA